MVIVSNTVHIHVLVPCVSCVGYMCMSYVHKYICHMCGDLFESLFLSLFGCIRSHITCPLIAYYNRGAVTVGRLFNLCEVILLSDGKESLQ